MMKMNKDQLQERLQDKQIYLKDNINLN
jgi:hypothetical protein